MSREQRPVGWSKSQLSKLSVNKYQMGTNHGNSAEKFTLESELLEMSVTDIDSFYNIVNSHMALFFNCQSLSPLIFNKFLNISSISNLKDERATTNLEIVMNPKINQHLCLFECLNGTCNLWPASSPQHIVWVVCPRF